MFKTTHINGIPSENIAGNEIVYTMGKSRTRAGAKRTLPLTPKAVAILENYKGRNNTFIFPPLYGMDNKNAEEIISTSICA